MLILGLHIGDKLETEYNRQAFQYHDSAAVLLRDGKIVAAIEEERLSRVKHCNFFPKRAIDFCLGQEGITLSDVDYVAINSTEYDEFNKSLSNTFVNKSSKLQSGAQFASNNFENFYQQSVADRIVFCSHHNAHVWSVLTLSGFDESLILILDGDGSSGDGSTLAGKVVKAHKKKFTLISILLFLYVILNLLDGERGLISYYKKQQEIENLIGKKESLISELNLIEKKNSLLTDVVDLDYLEILYREKFMVGKSNEKIYNYKY